MTVENI